MKNCTSSILPEGKLPAPILGALPGERYLSSTIRKKENGDEFVEMDLELESQSTVFR